MMKAICRWIRVLIVFLVLCESIISSDDGVEEILLNVEKISQLGDADVMLKTISRLALALNKCGVDVRGLKELQRKMLPSTTNAKCMDGSNAGYYLRQKTGSKKWLIFMEGGYYCFDKRTCKTRAANEPNLTSSNNWPATKEGSGILSWNPEENPFLFSANIVSIPYCSSDGWSGNNTKNGLHFYGSVILEEVVRDLLRNYGLADASKVFLAGTSAGATGVMLNIDRISDLLASEAPGVNLNGIVDSGWFIDNEPFETAPCTNPLNCSPADVVKKGMKLWRPQIPRKCRKKYQHEAWRCFFGYRIYPFIKSPLFVIGFTYDRAQLLASLGSTYGSSHFENAEAQANRTQRREQFVKDLAKLMNNTLSSVAAVFAPSCWEHEILTTPMWHSIAIDGTTLVDALRCWEGSRYTTNRPRPVDIPMETWLPDPEYPSLNLPETNEIRGNRIRHTSGTELSREERRKLRRAQKKQKRLKNRFRRQRQLQRLVRRSASSDALLEAMENNRLKQYKEDKQAQCSYRLFDRCDAPNCNMRCPNYMMAFRPIEKDYNTEANMYRPTGDDINTNNPEIREEILTRQR